MTEKYSTAMCYARTDPVTMTVDLKSPVQRVS